MALQTEMQVIALSELPALSDAKKASGARFVQMHCVCTDDGVFDAIYSWMEDDIVLKNYKIESLTSKDAIPSITNNFLAAFVFENEAHDLFGANIEGIAIDFQGHFYNIKATTPMSILSPEQKAARDKAAKVAAAKAAKAAKEAAGGAAPAANASADAELEAKLAAMDPEKAAKVRAARAAKAAKAAAAQKEGE